MSVPKESIVMGGFVFRVALLGGGGIFRKWGLEGGPWVIMGCALKKSFTCNSLSSHQSVVIIGASVALP